ncbi:hypothetical protein [Dyadobacter sp. CY347]|uniref:hypothetical protein n=1 Tax=Dyadobacter sp. CY347 TaxID=2909336 RepID=UPI001F3EDD0E|nr:hypothetical protein [Dyadobacter sp. CY347]MCF2489544.1 hypothetical protein [Dyadobacter sp. CY347]
MKNKHTLLIATFLLGLCVLQKEARYKAMTGGTVEKMYNIPLIDRSGELANEELSKTSQTQEVTILSKSDLFDFTSLDSASQSVSSVKLMNSNLLNISSGTKMLNN